MFGNSDAYFDSGIEKFHISSHLILITLDVSKHSLLKFFIRREQSSMSLNNRSGVSQLLRGRAEI
jgi:hypothetical protein